MISIYDKYLGKYITSDKVPLDEAYFKDLTLKGVDAVFDKIKHKSINGMRNDIGIRLTLPNLIKTLFGFKEVDIYIEEDEGLKAWTHFRDDHRGKTKILQSERGIRFEDTGQQPGVDIHFAYGLLSNPYITGEMVTAILLHEIGHNFERYVLSHPAVDDHDLIGRRSGEIFSDKLAAMYGYGPIGLEATMVRLNQRIRGNDEEVDIMAQGWSTGDNVHPFDFDRIEYVLGQLETDLKHQKNLDSRTRHELEQEIADYKRRLQYHLNQINNSSYKANFDKFRAADRSNPYRSHAEKISDPQRINDNIFGFKYEPHSYDVQDIRSPNSNAITQSYTQIGKGGQKFSSKLSDQLVADTMKKDLGLPLDSPNSVAYRAPKPEGYKSPKYRKVHTVTFPQYVSLDSDKPVSRAIKAQVDDQSGRTHIPRYKSIT